MLKSPIPHVLDDDTLIKVKTKYHRHIDDDKQATCVMLVSMSPQLQIKYENMNAYNMIKHVKELFDAKEYKTFKELFPNMIIKCPNLNTRVMFVIKNYLATSYSSSWVLDTGCGFHICNNDQELKKGRRLLKGEVDLRVNNEAEVAALTVGTYNLTLPSGMLLELDNCYFVSILARNIVSISYLDFNGFIFIIENKYCSFYNNDIYYGSSNYTNCLYVLNLEIPIFNINVKRNKLDNSYPSYLWH